MSLCFCALSVLRLSLLAAQNADGVSAMLPSFQDARRWMLGRGSANNTLGEALAALTSSASANNTLGEAPAALTSSAPKAVVKDVGPPPAFANETSCACFRVCNLVELHKFILFMPGILDSQESPWYAYLDAVYGSPPTLPFRLSSLRFWYHNSISWSAAHPYVFLPIAPCDRHNQPIRHLPDCSHHFCGLWRGPARDPKNKTLSCHSYYESSSAGGSIGTLCEDDRSTPLPNVPPNTWFEAMRGAFLPEGTALYGFWFKRAPGSAIWLNSGNTMTWLQKKEDEYRNLTRRWLRMRNMSETLDARSINKICYNSHAKSENYMPGFPFAAWQLGYDTIFIIQSAEVVLVTELAMLRPDCQRTTLWKTVNDCSPGVGGCAGEVALRTGWSASAPCNCDATKFILNCDSIIGRSPEFVKTPSHQ